MVIDGTGSEPKPEQTVVVSGDRIVALGKASELAIPEGARVRVRVRVINGTGKVLIPGLWDTHVHTRCEGIDHLISERTASAWSGSGGLTDGRSAACFRARSRLAWASSFTSPRIRSRAPVRVRNAWTRS